MARAWAWLRVVFGHGEIKPTHTEGIDMQQNNLIRRAWRAEPVAIVTVLGTVAIAVLEAMTSPNGWSTTTLAIAAIGAVMGLVERQSVFAPDTIDKLGSESSKEDLDADTTEPEVQP